MDSPLVSLSTMAEHSREAFIVLWKQLTEIRANVSVKWLANRK